MSYTLDYNPSRTRDRRLEDDVVLGIDATESNPPHTPEHLPIQLVAVGVVLCRQTCKAQAETRETQDEHANLDSSAAYKRRDPRPARFQMDQSI